MYNLTFHLLFQLCCGGIQGALALALALACGPLTFRDPVWSPLCGGNRSSSPADQSSPLLQIPVILAAGYACSPRVLGLLVLSPIHSLKTHVVQSTDLEMIKALNVHF